MTRCIGYVIDLDRFYANTVSWTIPCPRADISFSSTFINAKIISHGKGPQNIEISSYIVGITTTHF